MLEPLQVVSPHKRWLDVLVLLVIASLVKGLLLLSHVTFGVILDVLVEIG
jgi:hypothetical protein